MPKVPDLQVAQSAGGSLKKYQKEAIMIGGRVNMAQLEFLTPYVNSSQTRGGKLCTKRRNRDRHRLSRRR